MPKLVLARGDISPTDELVIVLSEPHNEPAAVLIHWPAAASVASPTAFPTVASKITTIVASAAVRLAPAQGAAVVEPEKPRPRLDNGYRLHLWRAGQTADYRDGRPGHAPGPSCIDSPAGRSPHNQR